VSSFCIITVVTARGASRGQRLGQRLPSAFSPASLVALFLGEVNRLPGLGRVDGVQPPADSGDAPLGRGTGYVSIGRKLETAY